ncbi:hypothetical protein [Micrococcoides hystricis]|uniref:Uncharacterized protein n=1 Tax=Micrococcoides hystricis TaxID=1572761 RepID=A0ABV6PC06_9MICC
MIDWKTQFELLEEQLEHMLVMVAKRFEEKEKTIEYLSELSIVRIKSLDVLPSSNKSDFVSVVCVANGPDLEYALLGGERSAEDPVFQRSNTFEVSKIDILSGSIRLVARSRNKPSTAVTKTLEKIQ